MIALILCAVITLFSLSSCNSFDALLGESDTPSVNTDATGGETNGTDDGVGNATGGAKRLRSKLYAERSEAAQQTRVFNAILTKAFPSGEGAEERGG